MKLILLLSVSVLCHRNLTDIVNTDFTKGLDERVDLHRFLQMGKPFALLGMTKSNIFHLHKYLDHLKEVKMKRE